MILIINIINYILLTIILQAYMLHYFTCSCLYQLKYANMFIKKKRYSKRLTKQKFIQQFNFLTQF
jgi:hypothetical protein